MQKIRMRHGGWSRAATPVAAVSAAVLDVEAMRILLLVTEVPETASKGVAVQGVEVQGVSAQGREAISLSVLAAATLNTVFPVKEGLGIVVLLSASDLPVMVFSRNNAGTGVSITGVQRFF